MTLNGRNYLERPLPSDEQSERIILAAILLDNKIITDVIGRIQFGDFYNPIHRKIFEAMIDLFNASKPIDPITISHRFRELDYSLDPIGGITGLTNLGHGMPYFTNVQEYVRIVADKSRVRSLIRECNATISEALDESGDAQIVFDSHEQRVFELRSDTANSAFEFESIGDLGSNAVRQLEAFKHKDVNALLGFGTGFRDLDERLSGLQRTDLIIIAGRPSMGKTALALTIADNTTDLDPDLVTAFFSLEMSKRQLANRMLASKARVDSMRYRRAWMTGEEWGRVRFSLEKTQDKRLFINDAPGQTVLDIRAKLRRLEAAHKRLDLVVVDYLQLMKGDAKEGRHRELSGISKGLKSIAKEFDVPVIALSQLSRKVEERKPPKPVLADLRESGAIEEDADIVLLLYREDYYVEKDNNKGVTEINVAKNRSGPTGKFNLAFVKEYSRFENLQE